MREWPDEKIRAMMLWYIQKHAMGIATWRWTRLGDPHPEVQTLVNLNEGEFPVASFFRSKESWYLFTTRRILGFYLGREVEIPALEIIEEHFGDFKGIGGRKTDVMVLQMSNGSSVNLEYETSNASMAPIYYFTLWRVKYPVLDKLKSLA